MIYLYSSVALYFIAFALDLWSTIIQEPSAEENPIIRTAWERGGMAGYLAINFHFMIIFLVFMIGGHYFVRKTSIAWVIPTIVIALSLFRIIIALTNFGIAPYEWTAWFQY